MAELQSGVCISWLFVWLVHGRDVSVELNRKMYVCKMNVCFDE